MQDVGAAIFFAEPFLRTAHIENKDRLAGEGIGKLQQGVRFEVGNDEGVRLPRLSRSRL